MLLVIVDTINLHFRVKRERVKPFRWGVTNDKTAFLIFLLQQRLGALSWHITYVPSTTASETIFYIFITYKYLVIYVKFSTKTRCSSGKQLADNSKNRKSNKVLSDSQDIKFGDL